MMGDKNIFMFQLNRDENSFSIVTYRWEVELMNYMLCRHTYEYDGCIYVQNIYSI